MAAACILLLHKYYHFSACQRLLVTSEGHALIDSQYPFKAYAPSPCHSSSPILVNARLICAPWLPISQKGPEAFRLVLAATMRKKASGPRQGIPRERKTLFSARVATAPEIYDISRFPLDQGLSNSVDLPTRISYARALVPRLG